MGPYLMVDIYKSTQHTSDERRSLPLGATKGKEIKISKSHRNKGKEKVGECKSWVDIYGESSIEGVKGNALKKTNLNMDNRIIEVMSDREDEEGIQE